MDSIDRTDRTDRTGGSRDLHGTGRTRMPQRPEPEGCLVTAIRLPVRVLALVVVVPVRLVWDALAVAARFLGEKALVPLGRGLGLVLWAVFVWPLTLLGRALAWLVRVCLVGPARWLHASVLTPLGHGLRRLWRTLVVAPAVWLSSHVLAPSGRLLLTVLRWLGLALFVWPWVALWQYVLAPVGRALVWVVAGVARGVGVLLRWVCVVPLV
ncbi:hypothetical protein GTW43_08580, partial [Streptomyces sp. SID5785]|nr:hypothetical protein [Streptomyces sp. SID5785]